MKKKIISILACVLVAVFTSLSFSACSLVKTDKTAENKKVVMKVGDTELTKSDILNSFYTYYQNNYSYFSTYGEDVIEESFYTWVAVRQIVKDKAKDALENGTITYSQEDEDDVWESVFDYIYEQVSSTEESAFYEDVDESKLPSWLRDEDDDEEETTFEPYSNITPDAKEPKTSVEKSDKTKIESKISELQVYLRQYADGDERIAITKTIDKDNTREKAYIRYIQNLVNTAKSNGKSTKESDVFYAEVERVYDAYYESKITELFQEYYLDDVLLNNLESDNELSDKVVAKAFLNQYFTDKQNYQIEDNYITTVTSSDGASLILYHFNGVNYFFTVQHILVKFDDAETESLKAIEGYGQDLDSGVGSLGEAYINARQTLANTSFVATNVDVDYENSAITVDGYYKSYIYDEERISTNSGYIEVKKDATNPDDVFYYEDTNANSSYDEGTTDVKVETEDVLFLATIDQIKNCYQTNYTKWIAIASDYYDKYEENANLARANIEALYPDVDFEDIEYVLDMVENIFDNGEALKTSSVKTAEKKQIQTKVASFLFIELEWIFSGDSLANEISNKMGYVISNYPDENGSWVADFAEGARELVNSGSLNLESNNIGDFTTTILSDYGYHIIKIENIYESGSSLIDVSSIATANGGKVDLSNENFVNALIKAMKNTYICSGSNETVYNYFFDEIYTELVGESWIDEDASGSGTYFTSKQYNWLYDLYEVDGVTYPNKLSYDELVDSVS